MNSISVFRCCLMILLLLSISIEAQAQEEKTNDSVPHTSLLDSLLIDRNLDNWSLRLFGNAKAQNFWLENDNIDLKYTPNNLYGIGFGVATRKLIIDIAFNIKDSSTENTNRFDMQGGFIIKQNVFDFFVQVYEGFNINNSVNDNSIFRDDIKSIAVGIDHLYLFNGDELDQMSLLVGLENQKRNFFSFGVGAFLLYNQISADSSIVPIEFMNDFNEQGQLTKFTDIGGGVMGGLVGLFRLSDHWYTAVTAKAGIGLMYKKAETETMTYKPNDLLVYKFNGSFLFGYAKNRFYTYFDVGTGVYLSDLDFGNKGTFNNLKGKWVFGYRFFRKK